MYLITLLGLNLAISKEASNILLHNESVQFNYNQELTDTDEVSDLSLSSKLPDDKLTLVGRRYSSDTLNTSLLSLPPSSISLLLTSSVKEMVSSKEPRGTQMIEQSRPTLHVPPGASGHWLTSRHSARSHVLLSSH